MLRELSVQNLALIEDARVELFEGYCAWTGETGAGKSLLLTALGLLLGDKASADLVRSGKDEARVAAVFDLSGSPLRDEISAMLGGPLEDDQLVVTRRVSAQGRSTSHINGIPVPVSTLRKVGELLIDIHGQHETRSLLDAERQLDLLDDFGSAGPIRVAYRHRREQYDLLRRRRQALRDAEAHRQRERALLTFERDELSSAEPRIGEHDELQREARRLASAEALREAATEGYTSLYEADRSAQSILARVARKLEPLADAIPEFAEAATTLRRLADEAREVAYTLRGLGEAPDADPKRLEAIETRLALYRRLSSRFHCPPDDLADRLAAIEQTLADLDRDDNDLAALDAPLAEAWASLREASRALTECRRKTAKAFARAVQTHLKDLGLGEARLSVELTEGALPESPSEDCPPENGLDHLEIVFAPNPGEPPRPLRKIASGGELSRVMLAIKTVLADVDRVPTLVFDEIDTGVGGRLGAVLGRKLTTLSRGRQIICVTHLPQMASYASHQWVIRKQTVKGRTRTTIEPLIDRDQRVRELAAMLRGDSAAEGTRQEALAMLTEARNGK